MWRLNGIGNDADDLVKSWAAVVLDFPSKSAKYRWKCIRIITGPNHSAGGRLPSTPDVAVEYVPVWHLAAPL
jgi:hypothetical protein